MKFLILLGCFFLFSGVSFGDSFESVNLFNFREPVLKGFYSDMRSLFEVFGEEPSDTFLRHPEILKEIKKTQSDFRMQGNFKNYPNKFFVPNTGVSLIVLKGCDPTNCNETKYVAVYDTLMRKAYTLKKKQNEQELLIFGQPHSEIKVLLIKEFLEK